MSTLSCEPVKSFPIGSFGAVRRTLPFVVDSGANRQRSAGRAVATYNILRLGLFGICFGIAWLAGLRNAFVALVVALLVSGVLSWFLLRRQREAMGRAVERTVERSRVKLAERATAEDSYVEAMLAAEPPPPSAAAAGEQSPS
jgi:hypothetical protein